MNLTGKQYPEDISHATKSSRFKTKKGHCYILEDHIVITNDRKIDISDAFTMSWWYRVKIGIFLICAVASLAYASFEFFSDDHLAFWALHLLFALIFSLLVRLQVKASSVKVINKRDIISAGYSGGRIGRDHSFFKIVFYENGIVRSTDIQLPKKNTSGRSNTQKAFELMEELMD
ncbi:hypothetical protein ACFPVY_02780 [Flavobacterium qiangtangense]|uniref:Uncharacterized protein n=1 Tax=Flavobacterium qiangtangense TaxID=1442595 RepID=A0ABW1PJ57_9FLAO